MWYLWAPGRSEVVLPRWRGMSAREADGSFVKSKRRPNHAPTRVGDVLDNNLAVNVVVRLIYKMTGIFSPMPRYMRLT